MADFDVELNNTAHEGTLDATTMAASDLIGGGIAATIVDIGATLWNSLPLTTEVSTADLLSRINGDALQVYQENPDVIHTASFIGGLAVPLGVTSKGIGLLKAGTKGTSWFGNYDRAADLTKITEAVDATKSYRDIARGMYARTATAQAAEAIAAELAIVGTMNAHPFMEDYMKDFGSNFTISALLGAGLGSGIGLVADRFAIRHAAGEANAAAFDTVAKQLSPAYADMTNSLRLQAAETSIRNLDELINARKELGKSETDDLTYAVAKDFQLRLKASQVEMFEDMVSTEIKSLPDDAKNGLMRTLLATPEMLGVENIRFLTEKEITAKGIIKPPKDDLQKAPDFTKNTSKVGPIKEESQAVVYFPGLNLYGLRSDAIHYADASVFGQTKEQMGKNFKYTAPNYDTPLELISKSSADVQKDYIAAWEYVKNLTPAKFERLHIAEDDGIMLNAVLWRMMTDPAVAGVKVKTSNNLPVMKQIVKEHVEKLVQEGKITAQEAANTGPDAVYYSKMESIGKYVEESNRTVRKNSHINDWINGPGKADLSKIAHDHYLAEVGGYGKAGIDPANVKAFDAIYNSPEAKELRRKFSEIADKDGNVYLYRGLKTNDVKGQAFLESMTTHYQKAAQFTGDNTQRGIKLYKVHVDDIVTGFKDVGGGPHNAEIIVRASARPIVAELSDRGKMTLRQKAEAAITSERSIINKTTLVKETIEEGTKLVGPEELAAMFTAQKQAALDTLIANGMPIESIAIKTNTDINVVKAYAMIKQSAGLDTLIPVNQSPLVALNKIKRYDEIDEAIAPGKQPLVLITNKAKNPLYIQRGIALDAKDTRTLNKEFSALSMYSSKSETAKEMADLFYHPEGLGKAVDIILARIGMINNAKAGSAFFNSVDAFARNMEDVGPAISAIGKEVQKIAASTIARVMRPIEAAMVSIQKDPAALVEFTTFYNVNAGLKGWRGVDSQGYLVQKVTKESQAGGKVEVLERVRVKLDATNVEREYRITTPSVRELIDSMQAQSSELRELANTINRLKGTPDVSDIGLWMPSFNPVDKYIAYVHDTVDQTTKLVWAKTEKEFAEQLRNLKVQLKEAGNDKRFQIVTKDEQALWNQLNGRLDPIHMERADIAMQKGGSSAAAIAKPDLTLFGEIAKGYEFYITSQVRNLADINMYEVTDTLHKMSQYNKRLYEGQPFSGLKKLVSQPKDAANVMRNVLLGQTNLGEYGGWQTANRTFETGVSMGVTALQGAYEKTIKPVIGKIKRDADGNIEIAGKKNIDYKAFNDELDKRNIQYPWKGMDEIQARELGYFNVEAGTDTFKRLIYGGNALAATMALRFGEIAQPIVNAMSMPILTGLAIAQKMPDTFMGVQKQTINAYPTQIMYEGIRAMHSPLFEQMNKRWEAAGYFKPVVSEVTDVMRATRRFDKGVTAGIENMLDSKFVQIASTPADYMESLTRKAAMNTGAMLAKRLYPEIDEAGMTVFARDFMDKSIGNFHAAQRPVMFQGTLGVALGLFQTYMWTLGQSIYRHLEHGSYKAIGKAALMQSSIFGAGSLPGFDMVSNFIADRFSDDNVDLMTGTYRATGDTLGDFILYGLPSNLPIGASFSTRGEISPRFPISPEQLVSVNFASQAFNSIGQMASAFNTQSPDMARSFAQALSLQSMSRPIARGAELATGYSITSRGNTVQTPEEVWTFQGVAARILSTRPLEEQKLRDADHLNHTYGALDRDNREAVMKKFRTAIRNNTLTDEMISESAEKYFRNGGTPAGWRSAVNLAIARTEESGRETLMDKLRPDSPIHYMINSMER